MDGLQRESLIKYSRLLRILEMRGPMVDCFGLGNKWELMLYDFLL
jgi:hypothetical protein